MKHSDIRRQLHLDKSRCDIFFIMTILLILFLGAGGIALGNVALMLVACVVLAIVGLGGLWFILSLTYENVKSVKSNGDKLENIVEMIGRNRDILNHISLATNLSDGAKAIIYRKAEWRELQNAVLAVLHEHDFDLTYTMIDAMSQRSEYADLAKNLRVIADGYRNATEEEQISQMILHIENLCDKNYWVHAIAEVERLIKTFPESQKAISMRSKVNERKELRKKAVLEMWDVAVKQDDTDRSIAILNELDKYLTPAEGLALQESASGVFKAKLHSLGLQFTLAVSEKQWAQAVETGEQIIADFPNSRMAQEIRGKMDVLKQRIG